MLWNLDSKMHRIFFQGFVIAWWGRITVYLSDIEQMSVLLTPPCLINWCEWAGGLGLRLHGIIRFFQENLEPFKNHGKRWELLRMPHRLIHHLPKGEYHVNATASYFMILLDKLLTSKLHAVGPGHTRTTCTPKHHSLIFKWHPQTKRAHDSLKSLNSMNFHVSA